MEKTEELSRLRNHAERICGAALLDEDTASVIARTGSAHEISALLQYCDSARLPVCASGSTTKTDWLTPGNCALVLNTTRMNKLLEHPWQDMTCTVQAGCTWSDLQMALAQHGQFVALDPLWPERATVGGVVAANDSGALRIHYGGLRDLVIGVQVVLADGTIARSGGKVVKNVAGYDLGKLLCGSCGTLGVITEVTFRLHALPCHVETVSVASKSVEILGSLVCGMLASQATFLAMQIRVSPADSALDVKFAASPAVVVKQREIFLRDAMLVNATVLPPGPDVWRARQEIYDADADKFVLKASTLPSQLGRTLAQVVRLGGSAVAYATGILSASLPASASEEIVRLRSELESSGGSLVLHRLPRSIAIDRWGNAPDGLALMRAVKQRFDPNGILNPGRFVGGI
jgi:glycolate oxidase FAD binding subunit